MTIRTRDACVLVRPATTTDAYGATVVDEGAPPARVPFRGMVGEAAVGQEERGAAQQATITRPQALVPEALDVRATDRIEAHGEVYEVDGEPVVARRLSGRWYQLLNLRRAE